jgi:hypothetical protein
VLGRRLAGSGVRKIKRHNSIRVYCCAEATMKFTPLVAGIFALALSACGTFSAVFHSGQDDRFESGMVAIRRGDFAQANTDLNWVAEHHPNDELGRRAVLVLAAIELDPRNPRRRLAMGADRAGAYLKSDANERWTEPIAQSLYLLALELGAAEERVAQAQSDRLAAEHRANENEVPRFPEMGHTVPARLHALEDERDNLKKKVQTLEEQIADRDKKLGEKDKELERIRKTIRS